jgi:hypothetical protein
MKSNKFHIENHFQNKIDFKFEKISKKIKKSREKVSIIFSFQK